jgi:hypothetical protein
MAYERRDGDGSLFKNTPERMAGKKEGYPPYSGTILIDGKEYWLDGWIKETAKGKFFSLRAKPKDAGATPRQEPRQAPAQGNFDDDRIPF